MQWSKLYVILYSVIIGFLITGCSQESVKNYTYPFSKRSKIEVISYTNRMMWDDDDMGIVKNGVLIIKDKIKERKVFSEAQSDSLFKFLFIEECPAFSSQAKCFDPRHAILFYDKNDKLLEYIEVCLECGTSEQSFSFNAICDQRTKKLVDIFKQAGIKYFGEGE